MKNLHESFFEEKTPKKVMKKAVVFLLVCFLLTGIVSAQDGWGEFTDGGNTSEENVVVDDGASIDTAEEEARLTAEEEERRVQEELERQSSEELTPNSDSEEATSSSGESMAKTENYWYALYVSAGALLIFLLLLFLLLRKPKNRWKK